MPKTKIALLSESEIAKKIFHIRGQNVMLDSDVAVVYGVTTGRLNEQVKRNKKKFPNDFMFQLRKNEWENLISQFATSRRHGGRRKLPFVFTEHGALQAANVLNSNLAVETSVFVIRAFNKMRELIGSDLTLKKKISAVEKKLGEHDEEIQTIFNVIKKLISSPKKKTKELGFHTRIN